MVSYQTLDGVTEVQVRRVMQRSNAQASVDLLGDGAGGDVAGHQVTEGRVAALQEVVALLLGDGVRVAVVFGPFGDQTRPSLRSDSDMRMVLDCHSELTGRPVGWN